MASVLAGSTSIGRVQRMFKNCEVTITGAANESKPVTVNVVNIVRSTKRKVCFVIITDIGDRIECISTTKIEF